MAAVLMAAVLASTLGVTAAQAHEAFGTPPPGDYGLKVYSRPMSNLGRGRALVGYDDVNLADIPSNAQVVGCYVADRWANCSQVPHMFPHAHKVSIATTAQAPARCQDTEPGNTTPSQDPGWARVSFSHGFPRVCVYADAYEMPSVERSMASAGIKHCTSTTQTHCYYRWIADWDGNPTIPQGMDAKQYWNGKTDYDRFFAYMFRGHR